MGGDFELMETTAFILPQIYVCASRSRAKPFNFHKKDLLDHSELFLCYEALMLCWRCFFYDSHTHVIGGVATAVFVIGKEVCRLKEHSTTFTHGGQFTRHKEYYSACENSS